MPKKYGREFIMVHNKARVNKKAHRFIKFRPKCPYCREILVNLSFFNITIRRDNLGYICRYCERVFIDKKYKENIFIITRERKYKNARE